MNTAIQETGIRELSKEETEMVSGGMDDFLVAGATIVGIAATTTTTAAFGFPIGIALIGMSVYRSWKKTVSV